MAPTGAPITRLRMGSKPVAKSASAPVAAVSKHVQKPGKDAKNGVRMASKAECVAGQKWKGGEHAGSHGQMAGQGEEDFLQNGKNDTDELKELIQATLLTAVRVKARMFECNFGRGQFFRLGLARAFSRNDH
jgi:hypothetical protein